MGKSTQLPIKRQCEILNMACSTANYQPIGLSAEEVELCRMVDEIHLQYPIMGSRRIRTELAKKGYNVNCKRVVRIMRDTDIGAIYPKPKTTLANKAHKVYPCLLCESKSLTQTKRRLVISRTSQWLKGSCT